MLEPRLNDSARDRITRRFFVREGTSDAELAVGVTRRCACTAGPWPFCPGVPPNARQAREASAFRTQGDARRARRGVSRLRAPPRTRRDGARDLAEVPIAGTGDALPAARTSATLVKPLLRRTVPSIKGLHPRRAPWLPPLNVLAIMVHHVQSMRMACTRFVWTHSMHAANSSTHRSRARSLPSS